MAGKKIGLALSGGGARGFAHVGVLKVLVENEIPIDMIAGTSAGSIVGGAFTAGMSIDEIQEMSRRVRYSNMMRPNIGVSGMFSNAPMGRFLSKFLPVKNVEETRMPFAAVTFDLAAGEVVVKRQGDLVTAIRASSAVPGIFAPVRDAEGRALVDGGVTVPIPIDVVRSMGADVVIGVDLIACGATFQAAPRTAVGIMIRSALTQLQLISSYEQKNADLVIEPAIAHLRMDQIKKREEFIELGEQAARERMDEIRKLVA